MAIEQSMMEQNFHSISEMRNAPTPPLIKSEDQFDLTNMDFSAYQGLDDCNFGLLPSSNQTTTITFQQQYDSTSSELIYQDQFAHSSFPVMPTAPSQYPASFPTPNSFMDETISGRESVSSKLSRKEKCMSRNAVAARENREKKKNELTTLRNKVGLLQEESATYKKKYSEIKEQYKLAQERNQYYESILTNLPSLMGIIEHMKALPKDDNSKRHKKKVSNNYSHNNLGVCFHVKASQEMSLKFCEQCSNGAATSAKKKIAET